jgi:hypothetical protein
VEQHILELGQVIQTHELGTCMGEWCAIHRPMPGPWSTWPRYWQEEEGRMVRVCRCGIGHPVAEMYAWAIVSGRIWQLPHDCCGIHPCTPIDGGMG